MHQNDSIVDVLLDEISESQRSKWQDMIEYSDFTHGRRKAWKTNTRLQTATLHYNRHYFAELNGQEADGGMRKMVFHIILYYHL